MRVWWDISLVFCWHNVLLFWLFFPFKWWIMVYYSCLHCCQDVNFTQLITCMHIFFIFDICSNKIRVNIKKRKHNNLVANISIWKILIYGQNFHLIENHNRNIDSLVTILYLYHKLLIYTAHKQHTLIPFFNISCFLWVWNISSMLEMEDLKLIKGVVFFGENVSDNVGLVFNLH